MISERGKIASAYMDMLDIDSKRKFPKYRDFYKKKNYAPFFQQRNEPFAELIGESNLSEEVISPVSEGDFPKFAINHPHSLTESIIEKENDVIYVNEALEKSYSKEVFLKQYRKFLENNVDGSFLDISTELFYNNEQYIKDTYNLKRVSLRDFAFHYFDNDALITVPFPIDVTNAKSKSEVNEIEIKKLNELLRYLYVIGWNFSYKNLVNVLNVNNSKGEISVVEIYMLTFEKIYHNVDLTLPETIYHVAPIRSMNRIARQGLVPKSKSDNYEYPDRVYFFRKKDIGKILNYGASKTMSIRRDVLGKTNGMETEFVNDSGFCILQIRRESLEKWEAYRNKKITFYLDSMFDGRKIGLSGTTAIFTYNTIPPQLIDDTFAYFEVDSKGAVDVSNVKIGKLGK